MRWWQKVSVLLRGIFVDNNGDISGRQIPDSFYRGIASESDIENGVYLKSSAFLFGSVPDERADRNRELSIVWNDCSDALQTLLRQENKKKSGPQFPCGYATIRMTKFEETFFTYITNALLTYERKPIKEDVSAGIQENPYHGNILLHEKASDQLKKNIQHTLATIAVFSRRK